MVGERSTVNGGDTVVGEVSAVIRGDNAVI